MSLNNLKNPCKTFFILLVIVIPFALYLTNLKSTVFNEEFYHKEFQKYKIYDKFPGEDIEKINSDLLNYLRYEEKNKEINSDFFNEKEKKHLIDVKRLIQSGLLLLNISFIIFVLLMIVFIYYSKKNIMKNIGKIFLYGGVLTFMIIGIFLLSIRFGFNFVFNLFHNAFFKPGTWTFGLDENIINLYPSGFFYDTSLKIVFDSLAMAFILILIGALILNYKKLSNMTRK